MGRKQRRTGGDRPEHFLRGRQHLHAQTSTSFDIAEREFTRAIEIDAGYAPAHAGLAQVYMWYVDWMGRPLPSSATKLTPRSTISACRCPATT